MRVVVSVQAEERSRTSVLIGSTTILILIIFTWGCHAYKFGFNNAIISVFDWLLYTSDPKIWTIPAELSYNPNQTHLTMLINQSL